MSFFKLFQLIFITFHLYLLGDVFYRWDAFKYYATFFEFIPSVALISTLWSITAFLVSIFAWVILKILISFFKLAKLKINYEHVMVFTGFLLFFVGVVWICKKLIFPDYVTSSQFKSVIILCLTILSVLLTIALRNNVERWVNDVYERLNPLVWMFGLIVVLSVPIVAYYAFLDKTEVQTKQNIDNTFSNGTNRPNIILVTYDALTARNMSVYGYKRNTTPFIAKWAKSATVFDRCEAAGNKTSETIASLMTGKRVWSHRRYHSDAGKPLKIDSESLPLLLKNGGYYNMAFVANDIASVKKVGVSGSFDVKPSYHETISPASLYGFLRKNLYKFFGAKIKLHDWILKEDFILDILLPDDYVKYPYKTEFPVEKVFDNFFSEVKKHNGKPFFAWIHLYPPHAPYLPPKQFVGMFDSSNKYTTAKSQYKLINPRYFDKSQRLDADIIRNRYDEFIRYCDEQFENFINRLKEDNKFDNTVIILSSDHGESFDHGYFTHGSHILYEDMTHIPLIIKEPNQSEGRVIDQPVEQIDVPATILEFAGLPHPAWMEGRSLVPAMRGEQYPFKNVFSMNLEETPVLGHKEINRGIIALWEGDYKLIYYIHSDSKLLFNLDQDPYERNNIYSSNPDTAQRLLRTIKNSLKGINDKIKNE